MKNMTWEEEFLGSIKELRSVVDKLNEKLSMLEEKYLSEEEPEDQLAVIREAVKKLATKTDLEKTLKNRRFKKEKPSYDYCLNQLFKGLTMGDECWEVLSEMRKALNSHFGTILKGLDILKDEEKEKIQNSLENIQNLNWLETNVLAHTLDKRPKRKH
jgi:hypothetical protein